MAAASLKFPTALAACGDGKDDKLTTSRRRGLAVCSAGVKDMGFGHVGLESGRLKIGDVL